MFHNRKILVAILPLVSIAFYFRLFENGFFQQDEWFVFSEYVLHRGLSWGELMSYFFTPSVGHYTPLTILVVHVLFSTFELNYPVYLFISLILHATSLVTFFYLAVLIFKDMKLAWLSSFLFGIMASHFQATSWIIANIPAHLSSIFGLLSLILLFKLTDGNNTKNIYISIFFLLTSLLFKETTIFLFALGPLAVTLFDGNSKHTKSRWMKLIILCGMGYLLLRALMFLSPIKTPDTTVFSSQTKLKFVYNFITVPLKAISQTIVPEGSLKYAGIAIADLLGDHVTGEKGTPRYDIFVLKQVMESISLSLSLFFLGMFVYCTLKNRSNYLLRVGFFGLSWLILGGVIFAFAPEKPGVIFTIDSRYLYFVSMGGAIFIVSLLSMIFQNKHSLFLFVLLLIMTINIYWLNKSVTDTSTVGAARKRILEQLKREYPVLPKKVIFYTESTKSFYGLPVEDRILPFQSGLGQTLLSWYYSEQRFPKVFFKNRFLWDISSQGYMESNGVGFGYFRDFELLSKSIGLNKIPLENVIAYRYDASDNSLSDITNEVRGRLKGRFSEKRAISTSNFTLFSSFNKDEVRFAVDGRRETKWDSKIPYMNSQYFQIDLKHNTKVAEVVIDSYNNLNQDKVGYDILVSVDGKDWKRVFYSKVHPPGKDGITNLSFDPTISKMIKINQIGDHEFSSWVIHEIKIYEAIN